MNKVALVFNKNNSQFWIDKLIPIINQKIAPEHIYICNNLREINLARPNIIICHETSFLLKYISQNMDISWIQCMSAGVDKLANSLNNFGDKTILTTVKGIHKVSISEYCLSFILFKEKNLNDYYSYKNYRIWNRKRSSTLQNKKALIVGAGSIGSNIAKTLSFFGVFCDGIASKIRKIKFFRKIYKIKSLSEIISDYDYIICALPLTPNTANTFNKKIFSLFKKNSIFINVSRSAVVNTKELSKFLLNQKFYAFLDVFDDEPLDKKSNLWNLDNLFITPHITGFFNEGSDLGLKIVRKNLTNFINKKQLINMVDLKKGY